MPMPPPKPSTEGHRDRLTVHEIRQIVRALRTRGPQSPAELSELIGAEFWEPARFEHALTLARSDGQVVRMADGRLAAP